MARLILLFNTSVCIVIKRVFHRNNVSFHFVLSFFFEKSHSILIIMPLCISTLSKLMQMSTSHIQNFVYLLFFFHSFHFYFLEIRMQIMFSNRAKNLSYHPFCLCSSKQISLRQCTEQKQNEKNKLNRIDILWPKQIVF